MGVFAIFRARRKAPAKTGAELGAGVRKKSFELNYGGGTIWCEHLDGMGACHEEVIRKLNGDLPKLLRPSVSSFMIINLDETEVTEEIAEAIVSGIVNGAKRFRKIALIGVDDSMRGCFTDLAGSGAVSEFMDDYEKAKQWCIGGRDM